MTDDGLKLRKYQKNDSKDSYIPLFPKARIYENNVRVIGSVEYILKKAHNGTSN